MGIKDRLLMKAKSSNNKLFKGIVFKIYDLLRYSRVIAFFRYKPWISDKKYIEKKYKRVFGEKPNLECPRNFNEKNNWRKLYDRNDLYTKMVDKYQIKELIREKVGAEYTFPLIAAWDHPKDIDFDVLPNSFVLKVNHSGGVIVCRNKDSFDYKRAVWELKKEQRMACFPISREWPYKNVRRKIICEQYMGENLIDYKNYCFNGKVYYTFVWRNRSKEDGRKPEPYLCGAYDVNWEKKEIALQYPSIDSVVERPDCYNEMIRIAEKMSEGIPFVRVDCYVIDGKPYIGEMTFFPYGGFLKFEDQLWNNRFGDMEELPAINNRENFK